VRFSNPIKLTAWHAHIFTLKSYNEEAGRAARARDRSMEKVEFTLDGPSPIVPARGCILLVRFRLTEQQETDSVFCDYGMRSGHSLQLFNGRFKALLFDATISCDYALKVGITALPAEQVVEIFQLPTPPWYRRLEEDAQALACQSRDLAEEIGLADLFRAMIGAK
jgi:hypothetical protein